VNLNLVGPQRNFILFYGVGLYINKLNWFICEFELGWASSEFYFILFYAWWSIYEYIKLVHM
jgi:hypothetical protein